MSDHFILVGSDPNSAFYQNPGGQFTASKGLIEYSRKNGLKISIVDTTQASFPAPSILNRSWRGIKRVFQLILILTQCKTKGAIIFSCSGISLFERTFMSGICRLKGVKSALFIRDGNFIKDIHQSTFKRWVFSKLLTAPDWILGQGEKWREEYLRLGVDPIRISIIRNWLSDKFPTQNITKRILENQQIHFIFLGWLVKEKGVMELTDAVKELSKKYLFRITLIGDGTMRPEIQKVVDNFKLKKFIHITGWQSQEQVHAWLSKAHVIILPSYMEGFSNAILEGLAFGMPVICTDVGGMADSVINNHNGMLLTRCNQELIYDAMRKYIENPSLVEDHSKESLKLYYRNHDQNQNCEELFKLFKE
jgi:glycosyltransferase involved in cell wall biosynthesis